MPGNPYLDEHDEYDVETTNRVAPGGLAGYRWVWTGRVRAVKEGNKLFLAASDIPRVGSEAVEDPEASGTSLAAWAERVEQTRTGGNAGATAQDLVLEDRAARADR